MDLSRTLDCDAPLEANSEVKLKIQYQLLQYVIGYFDDTLGHDFDLDGAEDPLNLYALFAVEALSEKYAVWFESFCAVHENEEGKTHKPLTVEDFLAIYDQNPQKVLEGVIAHLRYESVDDYLRELVEWFKVTMKSNEDGSLKPGQKSVVQVTSAARKDLQKALKKTV